MTLSNAAAEILSKLGVDQAAYTGGTLASYSPVTGEQTGALPEATVEAATAAIATAILGYHLYKDTIKWK